MENQEKKQDIIGNAKSAQDGKFINVWVNVDAEIKGLIISQAKRKAGEPLPAHLFENKKGETFLKLKLVQRKEVSQYGETHFIVLDDYVKEKKEG